MLAAGSGSAGAAGPGGGRKVPLALAPAPGRSYPPGLGPRSSVVVSDRAWRRCRALVPSPRSLLASHAGSESLRLDEPEKGVSPFYLLSARY